MDNEYKAELDRITKTLENAIEMKWITKNEHIVLKAISHNILGDLHSLKREQQKQKEIGEAFSALQEYMPDIYQVVLEELNRDTKDFKSKIEERG